MAALAGDRGDVGGDRVGAAEVVKQPAVEAVGLQRRLDRADVEAGRRLWSGTSPTSIIGSRLFTCASAVPRDAIVEVSKEYVMHVFD